MFGNNLLNTTSSLTKGISLTKILGGASKALNIANQAIPVYYQVKPLLGNAKTLLNMYNSIKTSEPKPKIANNVSNTQKKESIDNYVNDTLTFFL